jgi:hypothetical protein
MHEQDYEIQADIMAVADRRFGTDVAVVYFVQAGDKGPIKIGFSRKFAGVRPRINGIQTGCPWPVYPRRVMEAPRGQADEYDLHQRFARIRLAGEWFHATAELAELAHATPTGDDADVRLLRAAFDRGFAAGQEFGEVQARAWFAKDIQTLAARYDDSESEYDLAQIRRDALHGLRRAA